jgi:ribosome-binding protein aMBF1 (putative translation factor)
MIIKITDLEPEELENLVKNLENNELKENLMHNSLNFKEMAAQINLSVTYLKRVLAKDPKYDNKKVQVLEHLRFCLLTELKRRKKMYS